MSTSGRFDALADLLVYPEEDWLDLLASVDAPAFVQAVEPYDLNRLRELYTRTFDLNPQCSLEIGWHLYGDHYERGRFMVMMKEYMRMTRVETGTELPDHLAIVLRVLGRLNHKHARELLTTRVRPGLNKMLQSIQGQNNPYEHLLFAIRDAFNNAADELACDQDATP